MLMPRAPIVAPGRILRCIQCQGVTIRAQVCGTASSIARTVWAENLRPEGVHVRLNAYIEPAEVGCNETLSPIFLTNLLGLGQEKRLREDSSETGFW